MGNKPPELADIAFELKFNAKQMESQANKLETQEKNNRKKILDALKNGQTENAKIFAENVIRDKKEALNTRRFGVKMTALASKVEAAARS